MESEILSVADYAVEQPGVTGYICVDKDGLCLAAKGQARHAMSGIINQLAELANKIEEPKKSNSMGLSSKNNEPEKKQNPVIRVELQRYKMLIQSKDSITTALISNHK